MTFLSISGAMRIESGIYPGIAHVEVIGPVTPRQIVAIGKLCETAPRLRYDIWGPNGEHSMGEGLLDFLDDRLMDEWVARGRDE